MASPVAIVRDLRLDLFRGLALWLIFLAHVPGTITSKFVPLHYGFSDPAEMFIFVSGYANAYVHGRVMEQRGFVVAAAHILNRSFHIYVVQMFLFVVFIGEIAYLSGGTDVFADAMNVRIFHEHPDTASLAVLELRFMPVNMDVLPVYVVLLAGCPPIMWLLGRVPALALAASGVVYVLANAYGLNFPAYPRGSWYFNPLAWQFLFVISMWCGLGAAGWLWPFIRSRVVVTIAAAYVVIALLIVAAWHTPDLARYVPEALAYPLGKTNLGALRLLHFLAIAILAERLIPRDWPPLRWKILRPAILCGQHSLEVFCLGVVLAFAGYVAIIGAPAGLVAPILVSVLGIAAMIAVGALVAWYGTMSVSFVTIEAAEPSAHPAAAAAEVAAIAGGPTAGSAALSARRDAP